MNRFTLIGNLTKDPEIRQSQDGKAIAKITVAVNGYGGGKEGEEKQADFFDITFFGKNAENIEKYLNKGRKVLVDCSVHNNNYTNKEGVKVFTYQFVGQNIEFLSPANKDGGSGEGGGMDPAMIAAQQYVPQQAAAPYQQPYPAPAAPYPQPAQPPQAQPPQGQPPQAPPQGQAPQGQGQYGTPVPPANGSGLPWQ